MSQMKDLLKDLQSIALEEQEVAEARPVQAVKRGADAGKVFGLIAQLRGSVSVNSEQSQERLEEAVERLGEAVENGAELRACHLDKIDVCIGILNDLLKDIAKG